MFLGNLFFIGFLIILPIWFWADHMYNVGMDVDLKFVIPITTLLVFVAATFFTWINWKITKGKF